MGYAEELERWSAEGYSGEDLRCIVDNGVRPREDDEREEEGEPNGCTCPPGTAFCTC